MSGESTPNWSEFTAAIAAQRAEFMDQFKDLKEELHRSFDKVGELISELKADGDREHGEMKEDFEKEIERLDKRINVLTGIGIGFLLGGLGAVVAFVIDILKLKLF